MSTGILQQKRDGCWFASRLVSRGSRLEDGCRLLIIITSPWAVSSPHASKVGTARVLRDQRQHAPTRDFMSMFSHQPQPRLPRAMLRSFTTSTLSIRQAAGGVVPVEVARRSHRPSSSIVSRLALRGPSDRPHSRSTFSHDDIQSRGSTRYLLPRVEIPAERHAGWQRFPANGKRHRSNELPVTTGTTVTTANQPMSPLPTASRDALGETQGGPVRYRHGRTQGYQHPWKPLSFNSPWHPIDPTHRLPVSGGSSSKSRDRHPLARGDALPLMGTPR